MPRNRNQTTNPIYTAWRHFGCNLQPDMFESIFRALWLSWQSDRAIKQLTRNMTKEQLAYINSHVATHSSK